MNLPIKEELRPENPTPEEIPIPAPQENSLQIPLTEEQEKELVDIIIQDFDSATEARNEKSWGTNTKGDDLDWEGKYKLIIQKYEGFTEKPLKNWMSSGTTKICTAIVETVHSKLFPAVWNENLIGWKKVEKTDKETAERINKLMTWVVRVQMKLRNQIDDIIKYVCKMGTCITKVTYEVIQKDIGKIEPVMSTNEMGQPVPIIREDGQPITQKVLKIIEKPKVELIALDRFYIQPGQTDITKEPVIHRVSYYFSDLQKMAKSGKLKNIDDKLRPAIDKIIVSKLDKQLQEAERISTTDIKRRVYPTDILEWYGNYDYDDDGIDEDVIAAVEIETKTLISAIPLHAVCKNSIRPFDKHEFIRRELKFYAIGIIELVLPLAEEADACLRQIRDANTIACLRFGFYDSSGDYNPETHTIAPLKMYPVADPQKSVYFPDISIPTERLIMTMNLINQMIEKLTAASSYVMGRESESIGAGGSATQTQAIVTNAEQRFDIPAQRLRESISSMLTKILNQVQMNIPAGMEKEILGEDGEPIFEENELIKDRIAAEMDAYLDSDPAMGDKNTQKQIAGYMYATLLQNPLVATDPTKLYNVTAKWLETYGEDPEKYLGPKPNLQQFDSPEDENTLIREGRFKEVEPVMTENHLEHITVHSLPLQIPAEKANWNPVMLQYLQNHILAHQQMMQRMMAMVTMQQKGMSPNGKQPSGNSSVNPNAPAGNNTSGTSDQMQNVPGSNNAAQNGGVTLNG